MDLEAYERANHDFYLQYYIAKLLIQAQKEFTKTKT